MNKVLLLFKKKKKKKKKIIIIIIISVKKAPALQAKDGSTLLLAKVQVKKRHSEGHIQWFLLKQTILW